MISKWSVNVVRQISFWHQPQLPFWKENQFLFRMSANITKYSPCYGYYFVCINLIIILIVIIADSVSSNSGVVMHTIYFILIVVNYLFEFSL